MYKRRDKSKFKLSHRRGCGGSDGSVVRKSNGRREVTAATGGWRGYSSRLERRTRRTNGRSALSLPAHTLVERTRHRSLTSSSKLWNSQLSNCQKYACHILSDLILHRKPAGEAIKETAGLSDSVEQNHFLTKESSFWKWFFLMAVFPFYFQRIESERERV